MTKPTTRAYGAIPSNPPVPNDSKDSADYDERNATSERTIETGMKIVTIGEPIK